MFRAIQVSICFSLAVLMGFAQQASATSCNTRSFAGDWLAQAYGVACELRANPGGHIRGTCYLEKYDDALRRFNLEAVEMGGRFSILSDCYIDGNLVSNGITKPVIGRTWANAGTTPDEAYVMPSGNQNISLF